ncbi:hypothetical protein KSX_13790 [Ktedonospora formicarum]|uniref:Transmembrane protein n=1 Tax=Ktedonospora formicarum TaxID=2778364 RepID=A0A8J3HWC0_9CHLR|nr:hypothetical protein KSX_13790 [Ktedonospora formicarum]
MPNHQREATTLPMPPIDKFIGKVRAPSQIPSISSATVHVAAAQEQGLLSPARRRENSNASDAQHASLSSLVAASMPFRSMQFKTLPLYLLQQSTAFGIIIVGLVFLLLLTVGMLLTMLLLGHAR